MKIGLAFPSDSVKNCKEKLKHGQLRNTFKQSEYLRISSIFITLSIPCYTSAKEFTELFFKFFFRIPKAETLRHSIIDGIAASNETVTASNEKWRPH